jgi:hypothetical protein
MKKLFILAYLIFASHFLSISQNLNAFKIYFEEGDKRVLFYGSAHDNNISNPMFSDIEESFSNFMPEIVLVEGGYNNQIFNSKEQAIENGEMAFVSYLSYYYSIPVFDIEPLYTYVDSILFNQFSSKQIFTMYILRQTFQYQVHSQNNDIDFIRQIENYANFIIANERFGFEGSLKFEDIFAIVESETQIAITKENWFDKMIEVRRYLYNRKNVEKNQIQIIHSKVVDIRDDYAIDLIISKLESNNKVFVIMGNQHLLNQEYKLREVLQKKYSP